MTCASFTVLSYFDAIEGPVILACLYLLRRLPKWVLICYCCGFTICALGWELWWTFGIFGDSVEDRRGHCANRTIPMEINWLLNSSTDGKIMLMCILLSWLSFGCSTRQFGCWDLRVWLIFVVYGFAQQMLVTAMSQDDLKGQQGGTGIGFGWAPLSPIPVDHTLFSIGSTKFSFQVMQPWILAPHALYVAFVLIYQRFSPEGLVGASVEDGAMEEPFNAMEEHCSETRESVPSCCAAADGHKECAAEGLIHQDDVSSDPLV